MRALLGGGAAAAVAASLTACGGHAGSVSVAELQRQADMFQIDQIEQTWHKAASTHDLDLMMSIWAPKATFTFGGQTYTGTTEIRQLLAGAGPFQPQNHWVSDTPAYKIRITVNGDKGTLYFECHYIDAKTQKVVAVVGADQDVKKINGKWLITNGAAASPTLAP